jgi:uncharacterized membrane protein
VIRISFKLPGSRFVASHAARAGILAASANVASTFARGLLPRSVGDQAVATGVSTAVMYQAATTAHAGAETIALVTTGTHGMRGREPDPTRTMIADLSFVAVGIVVDQVFPPRSDEVLAVSIVRFGTESLMLGGAAGAVVAVVDQGLARIFPGQALSKRPIAVDVVLGGMVAGLSVYLRHQHAREFGLVDPDRKAVKRAGLMATLKASVTGVGAAGAMLALATAEQFIAHSVKNFLDRKVSRFDIGSPLVGHTVAYGMLGLAAGATFVVAKRKIEKGAAVVEPAYPEPPTSERVTAGPKSLIPFDSIGKEGRRFVLMALTPDEISTVMREPAHEPVRVVSGFGPPLGTQERARLCFDEMVALGAFERSLVCIAAPTGVGYVSYTFAESLEYLTLGDCAIVVPQYALVPSAMALFDTHDGVALQRRVLELSRNYIASMPHASRPRLVQFGESLGAQVALDVAYPQGSGTFDEYGLEAGLYLGVPFRSTSWSSWRAAASKFDVNNSMVLASQPSELPPNTNGQSRPPNHIMIVHDDDPVNKFSYRLVVAPPWWMGPPTTRPPKVPRETVWRAITTFVLTLVDLLNGMNFKPGGFVRQGHDYRIDSQLAVSIAYGLPCTAQQAAAIDEALKRRERDWAARRLVARKFAYARDSVARTLKSWGVSGDGTGISPPITADVNPTADFIPKRFGSSGVL